MENFDFDVAQLNEPLRLRVLNLMANSMKIRAAASCAPITEMFDQINLAKRKVEPLDKERDAILELTVGKRKPVEIKHTTFSYCQGAWCGNQDFQRGQLVHFVVVDNNCVCIHCSSHFEATKEPRYYDPDMEAMGNE